MVLIALLLLWSINIFGWILGKYVQLQIHYPVFFLNSIPSIFIDFFLPGVIAILVGALLSQKTVREVAYCIIIVSALVCSPVPSGIFASESIFGYPVLALFDWFLFLLQIQVGSQTTYMGHPLKHIVGFLQHSGFCY